MKLHEKNNKARGKNNQRHTNTETKALQQVSEEEHDDERIKFKITKVSGRTIIRYIILTISLLSLGFGFGAQHTYQESTEASNEFIKENCIPKPSSRTPYDINIEIVEGVPRVLQPIS